MRRARTRRRTAIAAPPTKSDPLKKPTTFVYGFTRADLPTITQTVQLYHAATETPGAPVDKGTFARILQVADEKALKELGWQLFKAGIRIALVYEPDAPWFGQLMAIGVEPLVEGTPKYKYIRKLTKGWDRLEQPNKPVIISGEVAQLRLGSCPGQSAAERSAEVGGSSPSLSANFCEVG